MNITEYLEEDHVVLSVSGEVDGANVDEFESAMRNASEKAPRLVVDLEGLEYVSSAGLRVFLMIRKMIESAGRKMSIIHVSKDVMDVFSVTGFVKLLNIES